MILFVVVPKEDKASGWRAFRHSNARGSPTMMRSHPGPRLRAQRPDGSSTLLGRTGRLLPCFLALLGAALPGQDAAKDPPVAPTVIAITGGRVFADAQSAPEPATVIVTDGKITVVGEHASVPQGAVVVDAQGGVVTSAFIDAGNLGLLDGASIAAGPTGAGDRVVDMLGAWNERARLDLMRAGVGCVYVDLPPAGRLMRGPTGAVALVTPDQAEVRVLDDAAGVTFRVGGSSRGAATVITRNASLRNLNSAFSAAERHRKALKKYAEDQAKFKTELEAWNKKQKADEGKRGAGGGKAAPKAEAKKKDGSKKKDESKKPEPPVAPAPDPAAESMLRIVDGDAPLRVDAHWKEDILAVLRVAKEKKVRCILLGASEAWRCLDEIREARASVVLGPPLRLGGDRLDWHRMRPDLAKLLHDASIPFAFMTAGAHGYRLDCAPLLAALSVSHGLSEAAAFHALTAGAATIIGVDGRFGAVVAGKEACLQVSTGMPLDPESRVVRMILGNDVIDVAGRRP